MSAESVMFLEIYIRTLLATLAVEIPYVFIVMHYKSIRNIVCINIFTHVSYAFILCGLFELIVLLDLESSIVLQDYGLAIMPIITALFELFLIPLTEIWFYSRTNIYGFNKKIVIHTYIANVLSFVVSVFVLAHFMGVW